MTNPSAPPGWWLASDGNWYPPHLHPDKASHVVPDSGPYGSGNSGAQSPRGQPPQTQPPVAQPPQFAPFTPYQPPPAQGFTGPTGPQGSYPSAPYGMYGNSYQSVPPSTNGLAVASLVLSIVSLFGIGSILAIIFGFVARRQIKRSNGAQKGAGLALAGIIVGFVVLSLLLVAIAIPVFVGVHRTDTSVDRLPPVPVALGSLAAGGQAGTVPWVSRTQPVDTTLTAVPDGVEMTIRQLKQSEWAGVPVAQGYPSIQLSATVAIVAGSQANGVGLGCITPDRDDQFNFTLSGGGHWQIALLTTQSEQIIDAGDSTAIHPQGSNALTLACNSQPGTANHTQVLLAINGTPVANDIVAFASTEWLPTVQLCTCSSVDTGSFLGAQYYGVTNGG